MDSKNKYEGGAGYFCESSLAEEVSLDVDYVKLFYVATRRATSAVDNEHECVGGFSEL